MKRHTKFLILLLSLTLLSLGTNCKTHAVTFSQDIGVSFTFNPSIQINLSSSNLVIPNLAPGTSDDSNIITVNVLTNNISGYTLNATVGNNTTFTTRDLKHNDSNISNKFTSVAFGSSIATNSNLENNTWAYSYLDESLNGGTNTTWTNYNGLPLYSDQTNIATLKSTTDPADSTSGDDIKFKIAAKASNDQVSGTYNNVINFTAVANPEPQLGPVSCEQNKICYNENSLDTVEGTMGRQSANANTTTTLLASNFSREGYGFAGWNTAYDYSGSFYGPQEDITTPADMSNGLSLYAIWVPSAGSMQTDATSVCSSLTTAPTNGTANLSSVSALTDQRDNQTYAIAKLADGKCWMIENLRLEAENTRTAEKQALAQGYGTSATYGNFGGLADAESTNFSNSTTANSLYYSGTQDGTASIDIGTTNYPAYRMPRYNNTNTSVRASSPTSNGVAMYSYGNYYTWHAAIADLTYNGTNNSSVANTSLCPTGWHLPTGGAAYASGNTGGVNVTGDTSTFREFYNLGYKTMDEVKTAYEDTPNSGYAYYSSNTTNTAGNTATKAFRSFPNNFLYSGYFYTSSASHRGSYGYYWSSTAYDYNYSYYLYLNSSSVSPGTSTNNKYRGLSIRCTTGT